MTAHDLLAAKWKPTHDGWFKLCVEMRPLPNLLHNGEKLYIVYVIVSNDPEIGERAFAAVCESTPLSSIENLITKSLIDILSSKSYTFTPKHRRTLYNWLYDNGRRIIPE